MFNSKVIILIILLFATIVILINLYNREAALPLSQVCIDPGKYYVDAYGDIDCKRVLQYAQR